MSIRITPQQLMGGPPRAAGVETRRQERERVREQDETRPGAGERGERSERLAAQSVPEGPRLPDGEAARQAAEEVAGRATVDGGAAAQVHARMPVARVLDLLD